MKKINTSTGYLIVAAFWLTICLLASTRTQAQMSICDSLSYEIFPNTTLTVTGNSNGLANMVGSIDWNFTACNAVACYIAQGNNPYSFPLINTLDTVKLCYDTYVYALDSTMTICNHCDSLVYDFNLFTWVVFNRMGNPVGIEEMMKNEGMYKIYDMLGRELTEIPLGKMYIRNNKLYITR